ncbi:hypothetical protein [Paraburkholderia sp. SG-MS1]|uniref:hypothetical protein n=1 Tax=Paraburkholderia sp. SG-MS1 TaxID=2023741 RepID=UPI00144518B1|nr:hypothetical protein [Paraburkholderia sp. SG-MS1]
MMSTIAFSPVRGLIAQPRIMPFGRALVPFGHEWVLRLPAFEIVALYEAVSRTSCLSAELFRSMCCWDRARASVRENTPGVVSDAGVSGDARKTQAVETYSATATDLGVPVHPAWMEAAGYCIVSAAVLLAWMMSHYVVQHGVALQVQQQEAPNSLPGVPLSALGSALPTRDPEQQSLTVGHRSSARQESLAERVHELRTQLSAEVSAAAAPRQMRPAKHASQKQAMRAAVVKQRDTGQYRTIRADASLATHRPHGAHSLAGMYSPRQPLMDTSDEYGPIKALANTYTSASQRTVRAARSDSTDWAAHVTQRHIMEIPDQFSK